jgi:hypothetical protein
MLAMSRSSLNGSRRVCSTLPIYPHP